jgi:DNA-binding MarR family transcriptional regulator
MDPPPVVARRRHLDDIAEGLPRRAAALSRLFVSRSTLGVSRIEVGVLGVLSRGPRRITELAEAEGVTQPAMTRLVDRLQERGWVTRESDPADGRAVVVRQTAGGQDVVRAISAEYRALVHEEMAALSDEDVETLAQAIEVLDALIARLQEREP